MIHFRLPEIKDKDKIKLYTVASLALFGLVLIFTLVSKGHHTKTGKNDTLIAELNGDGYAITGKQITDLMKGKNLKVTIAEEVENFPISSKLSSINKDYYIITKKIKQKINSDYPIFINQGAYLFLYHNNFILVTDDFKLNEVEPNLYLNNGAIFNKENKRENNENIILIKLPNGLYMNAQEITIDTGVGINTVPMHSILYFKEDCINYYNLKDTGKGKVEISIPYDMALVDCAGKKESYDVFYEKILLLEKEKQNENITKADNYQTYVDLYQYVDGIRYDYKDKKNFYRYNDGYFMELQGNRMLVNQAPLYYFREPKLLLPADYVLVQPRLFIMNKLPALSEVSYDDMAVYTKTGDKSKSYTELFLYDGKDTYILFHNAKLTWDEEEIALTPLSQVTVSKDGKIGIYMPDKKKYDTYQDEGKKDVTLNIDRNITLNLSEDFITRPDGQEQILFSEPSLLNEAE